MSRDFKLLLLDMINAIEEIEDYIKGMDFNDFKEDSKTQKAVLMNLQIIGEAAGNLPNDTKIAYNQIEWDKIIGLRNVIAHEYFRIYVEIIWDTVKTDMPILKSQIEHILKNLNNT